MSFSKRDNPLYQGSSRKTFSNARELRNNMTESENILWQKLRNKRLNGLKFRRQHPIAGYIADFYCHESRLIIEIDGCIHDLSYNQEHDEGRTNELESLGIKVIRFSNEEVLNEIQKVLNDILNFI